MHFDNVQIEYPVADCQCDAYGDLIGPGMMCAGLEQGGVGICNSPMGTPLYCQGKVLIVDISKEQRMMLALCFSWQDCPRGE